MHAGNRRIQLLALVAALISGVIMVFRNIRNDQDADEMEKGDQDAELMKLDWVQSAMSFSDCFQFHLIHNEQQATLCCSYADPENGDRIEIGDPDTMEGCKLVPADHWNELSEFLRSYELLEWEEPPADLLDATRSYIRITWKEGIELARYDCDGRSAWELREMLQKLSEKAGQSMKEP